MPEAAVDMRNGASRRKDQVRTARKIATVEPISEPAGVETASDEHFRLGIPSPDTAHIEATLLGRMDVLPTSPGDLIPHSDQSRLAGQMLHGNVGGNR